MNQTINLTAVLATIAFSTLGAQADVVTQSEFDAAVAGATVTMESFDAVSPYAGSNSTTYVYGSQIVDIASTQPLSFEDGTSGLWPTGSTGALRTGFTMGGAGSGTLQFSFSNPINAFALTFYGATSVDLSLLPTDSTVRVATGDGPYEDAGTILGYDELLFEPLPADYTQFRVYVLEETAFSSVTFTAETTSLFDDILFDDLSFAEVEGLVIPEPTTLAGASALLGLTLLRRRRA